MKISLIGMSGVGKTYWAKKLESYGFQRFSCDDWIEEELKKELQKFGYEGIEGLAKWMGQPYDKQYKQASKKYLELEKKVLHTILQKIEKTPIIENIVVDTTGSVVYLEPAILKELSSVTTIIYFQTAPEAHEKMFQQYCKDPKPVIWEHSFHQNPGQSKQESLYISYPKLLAWRAKRYHEISHVIVHDHQLREKFFTVEALKNKLATYDYI